MKRAAAVVVLLLVGVAVAAGAAGLRGAMEAQAARQREALDAVAPREARFVFRGEAGDEAPWRRFPGGQRSQYVGEVAGVAGAHVFRGAAPAACGARCVAQTARRRLKRCGEGDPARGQQWHLERLAAPAAWAAGADGGGTVVSVVDDGVEWTNADLGAGRFVAAASYDWVAGVADPAPKDRGADTHGTSCAGLAVAGRDDCTCGVGVAPGAQFAAQRLIAAPVTDADEAAALAFHAADEVDVFSCSWGPDDFALVKEGPGPLARAALAHGVTAGRGGRGAVYVWAAGNGGEVGDNVNYDGYANSIFTIAVAAVDGGSGRRAAYSERGAALLVAAPSSPPGVTCTAVSWDDGGWFGGGAGPSCREDFGGTSAAAPMVAGVVALVLSARPELTWRDVQGVLLHSAAPVDEGSAGWATNGAGLRVSHDYGFGMVNASAAVALARAWTLLPPARSAPAELHADHFPPLALADGGGGRGDRRVRRAVRRRRAAGGARRGDAACRAHAPRRPGGGARCAERHGQPFGRAARRRRAQLRRLDVHVDAALGRAGRRAVGAARARRGGQRAPRRAERMDAGAPWAGGRPGGGRTMKVDGKVVVVTGGASGLGAACVALFRARGARVVVWDRAEAAAGEEDVCKVDVTSEADVARALAATLQRHGAVHVLINCAGIALARRTLSPQGPHPLADFQRVLDINVSGSFNCARLVAEAMARNDAAGEERGVIVHTASVAAYEGQIGQVAYAASKGAVVAMTFAMARDLGRNGIRVNAIAPGIFRSPMTDVLPERARDGLVRQCAWPPRFGEPDEFAHMALAIVENSYLNGNTFRIDAGMRMAAM
jgi:NAD(P)-dependent dehydrogenase (short-subunit alcohol dehydrogenase family)/subtilisin family serine protease